MLHALSFRRVVPVVALVAVGILTSITTRAVIHAARDAKKSAATKSNPPGRIGRLEILSQPTLTVDRLVGGKGGLDIKASASVGHKKRPQELVWCLEIYRVSFDAAANQRRWDLVESHSYVEQIFMVPSGKTMSPTFKEHVDLQPGNYTVKIGINEITRSDIDPAAFSVRGIGSASGNAIVQGVEGN